MGNMKMEMKKFIKKIVFISTIFFLFILNTLSVNAETYYINNSRSDFLYRLSNARDGDIIVLNSNISLTAGSNKSGDCFSVPTGCLVTLDLNGNTINITNGGNADNFGIKANSALIIKNGTVQTIDTNNSDTGILILDNVKVTNIMYLGNTQAWIVNGSYIAKLNVEQGKVNPGSSLNPLTTGTGITYNYTNSAPAMVGYGTNWKCMGNLAEDFNQANNNTSYSEIIMLKDDTLTKNATLSGAGKVFDLSGYTVMTSSYTLDFTNASGTNTIRNGKISGNLSFSSGAGNISLNNLSVTGTMINNAHPVNISSGTYNNLETNTGKITITNGFFNGTLSGANYEISGGYFVNKPNDSYLKNNYDAVEVSYSSSGVTYRYHVEPHAHNWLYSLDRGTTIDDTLVVTCGRRPEHTSSITLLETGFTYNDEKLCYECYEDDEWNFSLTNSTDWRSYLGTVPAIYYIGTNTTHYSKQITKPTSPGTYQATISAGDKTAYVDFTIKQIFDIRFNANGGKGSLEPISTKKETYSLPVCPFKPPLNKEFAGWSYTQHGEAITTRDIILKNDIVLYACWKEHKHFFIVRNIGDKIKKYSCHCGHYYFSYN